ncbi:hypothetical protein GGR54DRAFT_245789 [Hypoxylon sp. NC1633]|nr:hypothetical protein GGR54DRAFT_245789 [Hypoxylon sp. NC1633]
MVRITDARDDEGSSLIVLLGVHNFSRLQDLPEVIECSGRNAVMMTFSFLENHVAQEVLEIAEKHVDVASSDECVLFIMILGLTDLVMSKVRLVVNQDLIWCTERNGVSNKEGCPWIISYHSPKGIDQVDGVDDHGCHLRFSNLHPRFSLSLRMSVAVGKVVISVEAEARVPSTTIGRGSTISWASLLHERGRDFGYDLEDWPFR